MDRASVTKERLVLAEQALEELLGGLRPGDQRFREARHDLRNVLMIVTSYCEILDRSADDEVLEGAERAWARALEAADFATRVLLDCWVTAD